jgi:hypothetical protein
MGLSAAFHFCVLIALVLIYIPKDRPAKPDNEARSPSKEAHFFKTSEPTSEPKLTAASKAIQTSVEAQIAKASSKPAEANLGELDIKLRQLDTFIDKKTVDETAQAISSTFFLDQNQYRIRDVPVAGPLNTDTAQILDIVQAKGDAGNDAYLATMIDIDGHQAQVEITESEGKVAYEAFQKMKKFPAAEGLYRQVVMPMLQKIMSTTVQRN